MAGLLKRWKGLSAKRRLLAALLAGLGLFALLFATFAQRDTRVLLFATPLAPEQVAEVADRLAEWNEPFAVTPENIRVEARRKNALLLKLSLGGVPHAHLETSSETLLRAGPLTPQSVLDEQARDGLAGDLAAALRGVAGVEDAHVIIAPQREGAFADEASHVATASVRLTLRPGAQLSRATLEAVREFVAAGVPALDAKRVAVLDDRGGALGDPTPGGDDEGRILQESLQSALDLAVGAAATIVRVRVSYDPRKRETHDIVRKPLSSRPIGSTTADERYKSASKQYTKTNTALDRGSEVQDENIETPPGRLERISVAVAIDQARRLDPQKIRALATGTLGLVASRGDTLTVEELAFARAPLPAARSLRLSAVLGLIALLGPSVVLSLALLAAMRLGAKPAAAVFETVVQRFAVGRTTRAVAGFAPAHVRGTLAGEPPHTAAAIISALPAATASAVLEMYSAEERAAIVRRMSRAAAPVVPDYEAVLRRG